MKDKVVRKWHVEKLIKLIRKLDIDVVRHSNKDSRMCKSNPWFAFQKIDIGTKDLPWLVLASLSHELGHCLSVNSGKNKVDVTTYMIYCWDGKLSKKNKLRVLAEERQCWRLGYKFLRDNGLPINYMMLRARPILIGNSFEEDGIQQIALPIPFHYKL